jgi:hypothetical protein
MLDRCLAPIPATGREAVSVPQRVGQLRSQARLGNSTGADEGQQSAWLLAAVAYRATANPANESNSFGLVRPRGRLVQVRDEDFALSRIGRVAQAALVLTLALRGGCDGESRPEPDQTPAAVTDTIYSGTWRR